MKRQDNKCIEDDLKHFGISNADIDSSGVFRCKNNEFFREKTGVNQAIGACERMNGTKIQKARIIVDYDANFPRIITRVISQ